MKIEKIKPQIYTYRLYPDKEESQLTWIEYTFNCENGTLAISGDTDNYFYRWGYNKNEDFMHLMCRIDKHYLLNKISDRSVFLLEESKKETIECIEDNGWDCFGIETEEEWQECKQDILDIYMHSSEEYFFRSVENLIPDIDFESIIAVKDYPHEAKAVVDLFEKYLQPKLKEDFWGEN